MIKAINLASEQSAQVLTMRTNEALLAKIIAERESITLQKKPVYDVIKRIGDAACAVAAAALFFPVFLGIAAGIAIESSGAPVITETRVGKDGREFQMFRFRTTSDDTEPDLTVLAAANQRRGTNIQMKCSPRPTRIGTFLRKSGIDGLPQLVNVLKGDMSIIGPHAFTPSQQAQRPEERLMVKPGLSCYWQLNGRNRLSKSEQIELDRRYIKERSLWTDIKLIGKTFCFTLRGKHS